MTFKTIGTARIEREDQSVNYVEHVRVTGHISSNELKARVTVHCNAYRFQSWGLVELFDGAKWNEIVRVSGESLVMDPTKLYVMRGRELSPALFDADRDRLIELAKEVLL